MEITLREVGDGPEQWAEYYSSEWPLILYCLEANSSERELAEAQKELAKIANHPYNEKVVRILVCATKSEVDGSHSESKIREELRLRDLTTAVTADAITVSAATCSNIELMLDWVIQNFV